MAIKGSATIELTNADGSKEVIKHENMITNAVNDLCISQRGDIASILKIVSNGESYAQALFGGLLLFNETLNTYVDDYFLPCAKITGYASQDAYAGLDIARGSFNASEGGVQADGSYKFVWDFSTSQANGTIKALALCPNMMGQIGASNNIVYSEGKDFFLKNDLQAPFQSYGYMLADGGTTEGISNYRYRIAAVIGNVAYAVDLYNLHYESSYASASVINNGGIIKLYKFNIGTDSISLADNVCMARYIGCEDVTLPADFVSTLYQYSGESQLAYFYDYENSKLVLFPSRRSSNLAVNGTLNYAEIDIKNNMSVSIYTFTNNTAGEIERIGQFRSDGSKFNLFVFKDYILVLSVVDSEKKFYSLKRSDNTQVKEIKRIDGSIYSVGNYDNRTFIPVFYDEKMAVVKWSDNNRSYYCIIDMANGIILETNAKNVSMGYDIDIGKKCVFARTNPYLEYRLTVNPFILTTKNNLDSPVTKTASQTMKITYTLSETAESGAV